MEQLRLSVRGLVEFTLHGEDIRPGPSLQDMLEGQLGHKARQKLLGDDWQCEVPLSLTVDADQDCRLTIAGRMDAFHEGEIPIVEEIKVWRRSNPPREPLTAHLAQAVCYGHMLCSGQGYDRVLIRVAYVNSGGKQRSLYERLTTAEECRENFQDLLERYLTRLRLIRRHLLRRNETLRALRFPYESWRPGQREMAAQVYTAIKRKKRLFAEMPTGSGKSAATLFPALKALGEGLTGQVYYLTARTTQRQGPQESLALLRRQETELWSLVLDAKEKQCPAPTLCHPDWCPRARGHFLRDEAAINELLELQDWTPELIRETAQKYSLCPFELSLSLAEVADITVCDYNYALDPAVHIQRIFDQTSNVTLLVDEAHHLNERVRDMLGGVLDEAAFRVMRTAVGKHAGRRYPLYKALSTMIKALDGMVLPFGEKEGRLNEVPKSVVQAAEKLSEALQDAREDHFTWEEAGQEAAAAISNLRGFLRAMERDEKEYAWIWQRGKGTRLTALALETAPYLSEVTDKLSGVICFSATLQPMEEMKRLLGGGEEDACFSMASFFPKENLLVLREKINTRYQARSASLGLIAERIRALQRIHPGKYLVFFPSFAYMEQTAALLEEENLQLQQRSMSDAEREEFLAPYRKPGKTVTSLCVLGSIFSEGIDLPGDHLDGVLIVGVGLPQVNVFQETLSQAYQERFGNGFRFAYQIPGMQKVAQAAGRVIRTETDRGVVLLLDDRYTQAGYLSLCPSHWQIRDGDPETLLRAFWEHG